MLWGVSHGHQFTSILLLMLTDHAGSFRIFRLFGVSVYVHWLWLMVAYFSVQRSNEYQNKFWAAAEYLTLFAIVLTHEFGHALACKSVGGKAERIILWPLGGVAFVQPPMRPGAVLWSIAAGPLVNVMLVPVTLMANVSAHEFFGEGLPKDVEVFLFTIAAINIALLIFNMLPIYPLDGGQILQSLLWFAIGFAKSLRVTAFFGLVVAVLGGAWMLYMQNYWLVAMAIFIGWRAWHGYRVALMLAQIEAAGAGGIAGAVGGTISEGVSGDSTDQSGPLRVTRR
jgi:Zn-dependent protease